MVGSEVVRQALIDTDITEVTALVRKPLSISHPKLKVIIHKNFWDYSGLSEVFKNNDACLWCLGISQYQVSKEEYIKLTYDYTMEAAKAMLQANPEVTFLFLSGMGADSTEKSRTLFARIKGKTENALQKLPFKKLYIARPGGIKPIHKKENETFYEQILIPLYPLFEFLMPSSMITSVELAQAMLHITKHGADKIILENVALKAVKKSS